MNRTRQRIALLIVMLGTLGALKTQFDVGLGDRALDGDYYYQIARHVAEGNGLVSSVSLYHQGFQEFPQRVNQSPAWVLTFGYLGRAFGLDAVSLWLPNLLYGLDLVLLYLLALRLRRRFGSGGPFAADGLPDFGHVAVFLFGFNAVFFRFTSLPYTEGLAFALLFGCLLAFDTLLERRRLAWAALCGLCAGLAVLTRVQTLPVPIALLGLLGVLTVRDRSFSAATAAFAGCALLPFIPWTLWLASWVDPLTPGVVIGLAQLRQTAELTNFAHAVEIEGFVPYLLDRAQGVVVAFHPWHIDSYIRRFGPVGYLVLLVPLHFVWTRWPAPRRWLAWLTPERALACAMFLAGVGMLLPVHNQHGTFFKEWLFSHRHGLPLLLPVLPALAYAMTAGAVIRGIALAALAVSAISVPASLYDVMNRHWEYGLDEPETRLVRWLDRHVETPIVVTTHAQALSVFSRANFHWMVCSESTDSVLTLMRKARADYVIVYHDDHRKCGFADLKFRLTRLRQVKAFGKGKQRVAVFALRTGLPTEPKPRLRPADS